VSVYVDDARNPYRIRGRTAFMCHMLADTEAELHAFAEKLGMWRKWYQSDASTPHYDLTMRTRAVAVRLGAVECSRHQIVAVIRRVRAARRAGTW
jgi:CRISPR/Cas system CMR subunit Cmr4 (Cas7 group RAMP superfamily)